jgi:hypothetical protein
VMKNDSCCRSVRLRRCSSELNAMIEEDIL